VIVEPPGPAQLAAMLERQRDALLEMKPPPQILPGT